MMVFENLIYYKINIGLKSDNCQTKCLITSEGIKMGYIEIENSITRNLRVVDKDTNEWMKYHIVQDLRDIVFELYNRGEDISEMVELIHEMDAMAHHSMIGQDDSVYMDAEYDILTYVEEMEKAWA